MISDKADFYSKDWRHATNQAENFGAVRRGYTTPAQPTRATVEPDEAAIATLVQTLTQTAVVVLDAKTIAHFAAQAGFAAILALQAQR